MPNLENYTGDILVVDDSLTSRTWARMCLEHAGHHVREAQSAEEALDTIAWQPPDLVLLDVVLPDMDGFEATRRLREDAALSSIPILLVTSLGDVESKVQGLEAGANDFLSKPADANELLARARTLLRLKRNQEELLAEKAKIELLYRVSRELSAELELDTLLSRILKLTVESFAASGGSLILLDERGGGFHHISSRRKQGTTVTETVWAKVVQQGLAGWVIQHRESALIQDTLQDPRWLVVEGAHTMMRSALAAPLIYAGQVSGVLTLTHEEPGHFNLAHLDLLNSIASQGAVATEKARLYQKEQFRARQLQLINEVGRQVTSILDPAQLMEEVYRHVSHIFGTANFYIATREEGRDEWTMAFHVERGQRQPVTRHQIGSGLTGHVIRTRQPLLLRSLEENDAFLQEHAIDLLGEQAISWLGVPLIIADKAIGAMGVQSYTRENLYDEEDLALLSAIAAQVAIAIENARLYTETEQERGKLAAVLAGTDDAVVVTDKVGRTLLLNPAAERAFGLEKESVTGQSLADLVPSQDLADLLRNGKGRPFPRTAEVLFPGERTFYASVSPVMGVGYVTVIQDITLLKELEQMRLEAERAEQARLHRTLECYIGPDLVDQVLAEEGELLERRERVEAVILFADIRGFTSAAAALPPEATVEMLNGFFAAMARIIYRNEGSVIDLIGDELMASFGAPLARPDAEARAVEAAIAMQKEFAYIQQGWSARWGFTVSLGVGIDQGLAVMGNIGTAERLSFTLIGNVVNRAHRLVEQAGPREIHISEAVLEAIPEERRSWSTMEEVPEVLAGGPPRAFCLQIEL